MARSKKNEKQASENLVTEVIVNGVIAEIYEGEKADYVTIKTNTGNEYYDTIKIVDDCGAIGDLDEGDTVKGLRCTVSSYFDKKKKCSVITFRPVSN